MSIWQREYKGWSKRWLIWTHPWSLGHFQWRCRKLYGLGPHTTIEEMPQKFRGSCRFEQYMPSTPGRYGIKYWKVLITFPLLVLNFCALLVNSYLNVIRFWELIIPVARICQLKMLWKYLVLEFRAKRSKDVTNRHKNDNASYAHTKEMQKWNNNALNAIITCANNI